MTSGASYDLAVIGAGSGGVRAARFAARFGARVVVIERGLFGGTCVHAGCVPKKLLVYGAEYGAAIEDARAYGWGIDGARHDWATLRAAKDRETSRLGGIYRGLLDSSGCDVRVGRARLASPTSIDVEGERLEARNVLIATGSGAERLPIPGGELAMTSDDAFHRETLPRSIVVVGGGYVALEFAGIYRGLGADVTIVHRGDDVLRGFDHDVRRHVRAELAKRGVTFALGAAPTRIERCEGGLRVVTDRGTHDAEDVLVAVGRTPRTLGLGLAEVGVETDPRGAIVVDDDYVSSVPTVLAVGDVIGRVPLTPVATAEAMHVARRLFGGERPPPLDYTTIPTAVFCQPNVGTVGLTEEAARARGEVRVFTSHFRPMRHTLSGRDERALVKLVVCAESDRVLGVHVVGADAGEIVQGFAVALTCRATKAQLDATIGIHPTLAEELVTLRG